MSNKVINEVAEDRYGTIYIPHVSHDASRIDNSNVKVNDTNELRHFDFIVPNGRFIQLKQMNRMDMGFLVVDGGTFDIDYSDTMLRSYTIWVRSTKDNTVIRVHNSKVAGYRTDPAEINVLRGQTIEIKFMKVAGQDGITWFVKVTGETDGLITEVNFNDVWYKPDSEGRIWISMDKIKEMIDSAVKEATLYWNN